MFKTRSSQYYEDNHCQGVDRVFLRHLTGIGLSIPKLHDFAGFAEKFTIRVSVYGKPDAGIPCVSAEVPLVTPEDPLAGVGRIRCESRRRTAEGRISLYFMPNPAA